MLLHVLAKGLAGPVKSDRGVVDRNPQRLCDLGQGRVSGVHQTQDLCISRSHAASLHHAAIARRSGRVDGVHRRGRRILEARRRRLADTGTPQIGDGVSMDAIQPGQHTPGVAKPPRPLHGPQCRGLKYVVDVFAGHTSGDEPAQATGVPAEGRCDDLRRSGHGLFITDEVNVSIRPRNHKTAGTNSRCTCTRPRSSRTHRSPDHRRRNRWRGSRYRGRSRIRT